MTPLQIFLLLVGVLILFVIVRRMLRQPDSLTDKVVIITGASSGIGQATAYAFAAEGAKLVLAARREERLQTIATELQAQGNQSLVVAMDVTKEADRQRLIDETLQTYGRIDILINNAGLARPNLIEAHSPEEIQTLIDVNLHAPIRLIQLALPTMFAQQSGVIFNVSSMGANLHIPMNSIYSAVKAGIGVLSDCLRRELAPKGIFVSVIYPGLVKTPMMGHYYKMDESAERPSSPLTDPFFKTADEPEKVGRLIVDMVRYRRPTALTGGIPSHINSFMEKNTPGLIDAFLKRIDLDEMSTVLMGFGTKYPEELSTKGTPHHE